LEDVDRDHWSAFRLVRQKFFPRLRRFACGF
jgi:hypothetical protein